MGEKVFEYIKRFSYLLQGQKNILWNLFLQQEHTADMAPSRGSKQLPDLWECFAWFRAKEIYRITTHDYHELLLPS
jgi:hypothetical protein